MPTAQTIPEVQAQLAALEGPTSVNAAGGPSSYAPGVNFASLTSKLKSTTAKTIGANAPGWVILAVGVSGYLLSETRIIGPIFTIVIIVATLFQINQYVNSKGGHLLGL
jgi:hypothetical protein